ncbi:MAG: alpha/beta hydrolase [Bacteroidota bacterium]
MFTVLGIALFATTLGIMTEHNRSVSQVPELEYPFPTSSLTVEGIRIAYFDSGKGKKVLLFVHGLGSNASFWRYNVAAFSDKYRVLAIDLPGYGKSEKLNVCVSMHSYARVLAGFLQQLKVSKVNLVGHSMGGQISITFAFLYQSMVECLVLAAPAGIETFTQEEALALKQYFSATNVKATDEHLIRQNIVNNFFIWDDRFEWLLQQRLAMRSAPDFDGYCNAIEQGIRAMLDEPVRQRLSEILPSVLVIFGEEDRLIPNQFFHPGRAESVARIAQQEIHKAWLKMIPRAGHLLMIEQPEVFNRVVREFLDQ